VSGTFCSPQPRSPIRGATSSTGRARRPSERPARRPDGRDRLDRSPRPRGLAKLRRRTRDGREGNVDRPRPDRRARPRGVGPGPADDV
jgi:hypothetical protein